MYRDTKLTPKIYIQVTKRLKKKLGKKSFTIAAQIKQRTQKKSFMTLKKEVENISKDRKIFYAHVYVRLIL